MSEATGFEIAIVGMSLRVPGASTAEEFWANLAGGVESVHFASPEELRAAGISEEIIRHPQFVPASATIPGIDLFDAGFFGLSPREAEVLDPQHRLYLECSWEALEDAGVDPYTYDGAIGIFAGIYRNGYIQKVFQDPALMQSIGAYQARLANDPDYFATRVSYKLNLRGPAVNVQTACSTSLVAIHMACQSLISGESDMTMAGGISVGTSKNVGYLYQPAMVFSPDGHCRPFDASASGTIGSDGLGIVVLKRLADALTDRDRIYAVIRGSAINNDGSHKVGFTAPGVEGQVAVIRAAQAMAEVEPASIAFIETHGTGTELGDPIEIAALNRAFGTGLPARSIAIGGVKSNFGHLNVAAGVAGLIKAALALENRLVPPSLNFETPNPKIDFDAGPFFVNTAQLDLSKREAPLRAGVSSFGFGGTNAHAVLEEAPPVSPTTDGRAVELLLVSARSEAAADTAVERLTSWADRHPDTDLADAAFTLVTGRHAFTHRRALVVPRGQRPVDIRPFGEAAEEGRSVVFMFPGGGTQYPGMGAGLYAAEPAYRAAIDEGLDTVAPKLRDTLREALTTRGSRELRGLLETTTYGLPVLFIAEWAIARQWMAWGVRPAAMIGHSLGEYTAACVSGALTLKEALDVVTLRGRLFDELPAGAMTSVPLSEAGIRDLMVPDLSIAAVNAPELSVVSGPIAAVTAFESLLSGRGIDYSRIRINAAGHSEMVAPILEEFGAFVRTLKPGVPSIPFVSNVTGRLIQAEDLADPTYFVRHLRQTVRFADGLSELLSDPLRVLLEAGPGRTLSTLVRGHTAWSARHRAISSLRHPKDEVDDLAVWLESTGRLWAAGVPIEWNDFYAGQQRRCISLPTYPFERKRYWLKSTGGAPQRASDVRKKADTRDWMYVPVWTKTLVPANVANGLRPSSGDWLVIAAASDSAGPVTEELRRYGQRAEAITGFRPDTATSDIESGFQRLAATGFEPSRIVCVAGVEGAGSTDWNAFHMVLAVVNAATRVQWSRPKHLTLVTHDAADVFGEGIRQPEMAAAQSVLLVVSREYPHIRTLAVDLPSEATADERAGALSAELALAHTGRSAWRAGRRYKQEFEAMRPMQGAGLELRRGGVYWITGGLGKVGQAFARRLREHYDARLVLTGRTADELHDGPTLVLRGDVASPADMRRVVSRALEVFGELDGVIHAAGGSGQEAECFIPDVSADRVERQFQAKVHGLRVLADVLRDVRVDFCVLTSSLATVLGRAGSAIDTASDAFMDAFASGQSRATGTPWISIGYDGWSFDDATPRTGSAFGSEMARFAMSATEGATTLDHALALIPATQVAVSTGDLYARRLISAEPSEDAAANGSEGDAGTMSQYSRPSLSTRYVAPTTDDEKLMTAIWQKLLGIELIGTHDNFFELGGHSLLATQLVSRIRETFQVNVSMAAIFQAPDVERLAAKIAGSRNAVEVPVAVTGPGREEIEL